MTANTRISAPTADQAVARLAQRKVTADPDQEQHRGQEHRVAHVLVAGRPGVGARGEVPSALASCAAARLLRDLVLRHVGRAGRRVRVVGGIGRQPGVERGTVARAQAPFGETLRVALPAVNAANQALNETESSVRSCSASRSARLAFVRAAEAVASQTEDSVPHFAAAKPE